MMEPIRSALVDVLVGQGIANGLAGKPNVHGIGAGLPRGNKADPLTAQPREAREPMGNSGKGRQVNAGAKFQALHIVVDNSRQRPTRRRTSVSPCLVLVR